MRNSGVAALVVAVCISLAVSASAQTPATTEQPQSASTAPKLALSGELALWTVEIKGDKAPDFERIVARLQQALLDSDKPERRQQAAGWKVMKVDKPLPNGNIAYVHIISPVVAGADYAIMQALYDEVPADERLALYELYKGAFAQNLSLATGSVVADMSKGATPAAP